ncbi:MAG: hypothetical protein OXE42_16450 [Gammaproteobacteria bacterium]|nr:hypothetical protein [Gammaproteobacteria bacterium]
MTRKQAMLILLLAAFALPPLLSWVLYNFTDLGRGTGAGAHGTLVAPPRPVPDWPLVNPADNAETDRRLHGMWTLVYLLDGKCGEACLGNLYRMRQLRLATGKYAQRVQRAVLVVNNDRSALTQEQLTDYPGQLVVYPEGIDSGSLLSLFSLAPDDLPLAEGRLYLVDPLGNLMMTYSAAAPPGGIIKDLTRLLKYSRIG